MVLKYEKTRYVGKSYKRQPFDSSKSFDCFLLYLESAQNLSYVAEKSGCKLTTMRTYSSKYRWAERYEDYILDIQQATDVSLKTQIEEMRKTHIQLAKTGIEFAQAELDKYLRLSEIESDKPVAKLRDIIAAVDSLTKLHRLTVGESTENINEHKKIQVELLQIDELRTLKEILVKAQGKYSAERILPNPRVEYNVFPEDDTLNSKD